MSHKIDCLECFIQGELQGEKTGALVELERIIKLLEAFDTCNCDEDDPNPKHYRCGTNQGLIPLEIIALIKGEK